MDNQTTEHKAVSPHRDTALLGLAVAVLLGSMFAFYYFEGQFNLLLRTLMLLGGVVVTAALGYQTTMGRMLWGYVVGSRVEWRKISWPSRQESVQSTLMIAVVVLVMAVIMWGLDSALLYGVEKLTGRGS